MGTLIFLEKYFGPMDIAGSYMNPKIVTKKKTVFRWPMAQTADQSE